MTYQRDIVSAMDEVMAHAYGRGIDQKSTEASRQYWKLSCAYWFVALIGPLSDKKRAIMDNYRAAHTFRVAIN